MPNEMIQKANTLVPSDDSVVRYAVLLDYYGDLLSVQGLRLMHLYYHEDLSLAEVSAMEGLSRQAVSGQLQKQRRLLEDVDARLNLIAKDRAHAVQIDKTLAALAAGNEAEAVSLLQAMRQTLVEE